MINNELNKLRKEIDLVDESLLKILEKRFEIIDMVAILKGKQNLPIENNQRELEIIKTLEEKNTKLDPNLIKNIFKIIFKYSKNNQLNKN